MSIFLSILSSRIIENSDILLGYLNQKSRNCILLITEKMFKLFKYCIFE